MGAAFFVLLTMAALTSTISLLEVPVAHLIDVHRWPRPQAVLLVMAVVFVVAIPSVLANGAVAFFGSLPGVGMDFLTLMSTVWNNFALPIGGLLIAVFVGYAWLGRGGPRRAARGPRLVPWSSHMGIPDPLRVPPGHSFNHRLGRARDGGLGHELGARR